MPSPRSIGVMWIGLAVLVLFGASEVAAQGCAMCKTAVGGPEDPLSGGINASIYFMMAMPFVLFAAVGGWLTYMFWGHRPVVSDLDLLRTEREGLK